MKNRKDALGASMMEMILYMGLAITLTAGSLKLYADSVEKARRVEMQNQASSIARQINVLFAGRTWTQSGYLSNPAGLKTYLAGKGVKLTHPWKEEIGVALSEGTGSGRMKSPYFELQVKKLEDSSCMWLVSSMLDSGAICVLANKTGTTEADCASQTGQNGCNKKNNGNTVYIRYRKE